jgi:hypothetical protein
LWSGAVNAGATRARAAASIGAAGAPSISTAIDAPLGGGAGDDDPHAATIRARVAAA